MLRREPLEWARYFHTFNDQGTELLIVGGYQYACDLDLSNKLPLYIVELNTPLLTNRLSMMLGAEGDFLMTKQKNTDRSWDVFNNDIYLQFTYSLPKWRFTVGQLGYYRKYYNPSYLVFFSNANTLIDEEWAKAKGLLKEWTINQVKLAYAYSRQKLTVQTVASYYAVEDGENFAELGVSAYWKTRWLTMTGGSNLYTAKSGTYASFRFAPTAYLPHEWQIGMQVVYFTSKTPEREMTGVPVYGCLSVNKQLGRKWNLGVDWHDMFDAFCNQAKVNRHAANMKLQYRF